jgi:hypothetical protein
MFLSAAEAAAIEESIARVEARTGIPVVTAVVGKADAYAELPWMAFALGVSLSALAAVVADALRPGWVSAQIALLHTATILAIGGASALAAVFIPAYARLFLRPALRDLEVRHYAQSLFLRRELFKTRGRNSILRPGPKRKVPAAVDRPCKRLGRNLAVPRIPDQPDGLVLGVPGQRPRLVLARGDCRPIATLVARFHVDATHFQVEIGLGAQADLHALARRYGAHLDDRRARRMLRLRGHEQVEQQQARIDQVGADAQQRVDSGDRIGQKLERAGGDVRRRIA